MTDIIREDEGIKIKICKLHFTIHQLDYKLIFSNERGEKKKLHLIVNSTNLKIVISAKNHS